jgi:hypothetical protein
MFFYKHFFALILLFSFAVSDAQVNELGQRTASYINTKLDSLRASGVDTVLSFSKEYHYIGRIGDTCGISYPHYLVWQYQGTVYYQYILADSYPFTYCYTPDIPYLQSTVFSILKQHAAKIWNEDLQPFVAKIEWEGQVFYKPFYTSHPTYYRLQFYWNTEGGFRQNQDLPAIVRQTRKTDLLENLYDSRVKNLNYPYNHNSATLLLMNRIMAEIEELNLDKYLRKFDEKQAQRTMLSDGSLVKALKLKGADSVLSFSMIKAAGGLITQDSFENCFTPKYLIWKANGKTCVQKYIECSPDSGESILSLESYPVCMDTSVVHNFIGKNFIAVMDSEIFPVILSGRKNGQEFYYTYSSQNILYQLGIYTKDTVINLEVNSEHVRKDYSLRNEDGTVRQYIENANYGWNSSTALWKLIEMIERQVTFLDEKKLFRFK